MNRNYLGRWAVFAACLVSGCDKEPAQQRQATAGGENEPVSCGRDRDESRGHDAARLSLSADSLRQLPFVISKQRPTQGACFHSQASYTGKVFCLPASRSAAALPKDMPIRSIELIGHVAVTLYAETNLRGGKVVLTRSQSDLGSQSIEPPSSVSVAATATAAEAGAGGDQPTPLTLTPAMEAHLATYRGRADQMLRVEPTLLPAINDQGYLALCLRFDNSAFATTSPTDETVDLIKEKAEAVYNEWIKGVTHYNGFRRDKVEVRIFGFAKESQVKLKMGSKYEHLPVFDASAFSQGCHDACSRHEQRYSSNPDYTRCPRQDLDHFDATFWLSHDFGAHGHAQPHYVRLEWDVFALGYIKKLMRHEVGHTFLLDDMYDRRKFPTPKDGFKIPPTIMHTLTTWTLTEFDHLMLRHVWDLQKPLSVLAGLNAAEPQAPPAPDDEDSPKTPGGHDSGNPDGGLQPPLPGNGGGGQASACKNDAEEQEICGLNSRGKMLRHCEAKAWTDWSSCQDPDKCVDGSSSTKSCGLNGGGEQKLLCQSGDWTLDGGCAGDDICRNDATQTLACSHGSQATKTRTCSDGVWGAYSTCPVAPAAPTSPFRLDPVAADAAGPLNGTQPGCLDGTSKLHPSIGTDAANWFSFGGCGTSKTYFASPGARVELTSRNDCCPGCLLNTIDYSVDEYADGQWTTMATISHPTQGECGTFRDSFNLRTGWLRVRLRSGSGFYLDVSK